MADDRYSRQIKYEKIGTDGQKKIGESIICIAGCGALGSNSAEIMVRAGVKELILIDFDVVEESNLQRQALYDEKDIGEYKVNALAAKLNKINSKIEIKKVVARLSDQNIDVLNSDIIIDGTDNLKTRRLVNKYAVEKKIPAIFGLTVRSEGMVFPVLSDGPCYECIFKKSDVIVTAGTDGIIASAPKITASLQCAIALKMLVGEKVESEMIKFNLWDMEFSKIKLKKNRNCKICQ